VTRRIAEPVRANRSLLR